VTHGPRKKRLDFGGNPDQVTSWLALGGVRASVTFRLCKHHGPMTL